MTDATEPPFAPRERLQKYQQIFQTTQKHTYLKGRFDKITSVAIPLALAGSALFLIGRGIYNMSHGIGKKERTRLVASHDHKILQSSSGRAGKRSAPRDDDIAKNL